ncbi:hypothetical protein ACIOHS_48265 [Streptomyces sp. NPDC088253]|uniref:hypothetical protein n=1 Tax=Streptomyces sp. NPDC088253 TaxID=3365846 RepID=UPI003804447B
MVAGDLDEEDCVLGRNKNHRKLRLPEYEMTPEFEVAQNEVIDAHYVSALRCAFTSCADPRADIYDIVEMSFARLVAGWMLWEMDPQDHLLRLVEEYSAHALRRLPPHWDPEYWFTANYIKLFRDVASPEELVTLKAIMTLDDEERRLYEARRVYGWTVRETSDRIDVNKNSVGPMTSRIEQRLDRTEGASAQAAKALFDRYMQEGGGF